MRNGWRCSRFSLQAARLQAVLYLRHADRHRITSRNRIPKPRNASSIILFMFVSSTAHLSMIGQEGPVIYGCTPKHVLGHYLSGNIEDLTGYPAEPARSSALKSIQRSSRSKNNLEPRFIVQAVMSGRSVVST